MAKLPWYKWFLSRLPSAWRAKGVSFTELMRDIVLESGALDPKQAYKKNVWAFSSVRGIYNSINGVPWYLRTIKSQTIADKNNPWYRALLNPNPLMESLQLWKLHTILFETRGECFWVLMDGAGKPMGFEGPPEIIWIYGPDKVKPVVNEETGLFTGWRLQPRLDREFYIFLQQWQVLRFFEVDPDNILKGMSPLQPAEMSIKVQGKAMGFNDAYLDNGAKLDGVLTMTAEEYNALGEEQTELIQERFQDRYGGFRKNGRVPLIAGMEWKPTGQGPKDMDFGGLMEWTQAEVLTAFGVPKHIAGVVKDLNLATAQEENKLFYNFNIIPKLRYFASVINNKLLLGTGLEFYFDERAIKALQESMDGKTANAKTLVTELGYSPNEVNEKLELGMERIKEPWGDKPVDPRTMGKKEEPAKLPGEKPKKEAPILPLPESKEADDYAKNYWEDVVKPVERLMARKMVSYFLRMKKDVLRKWDALHGSKAAVVITRDALFTKDRDDDLREPLFDSDKWDDKLKDESLPYHSQAFTNSINYLRAEIETFYFFQPGAEKVADLLREKNDRIVTVNRTVAEQLKAALAAGVAVGENGAQLRGRLQDVFRNKIDNVSAITETETAQAANMIRHEAMADEHLLKEWMDANDGHVRGTHDKYGAMKPKPIDFEYAPGLKFPCDPDCEDASEVVRCRCAEKPKRREMEV